MTREHVRRNRASWNAWSAEYQAKHGPQLDEKPLAWGVWGVPESELDILGDLSGKRVLELGCGGAQWSRFLAERGVDVVGIDLSESQLAHARRASRPDLRLLQANAEACPFGAASFDVVFCDHGATSFCDPRRVVPEAARLLRDGGLFAFNIASPLLDLCWDDEADAASTSLQHDYFELDRTEADGAVSFQLPYGEWIRLFRSCGLDVEDLIEIRPGKGARTTYDDYVPLAWARRFAAENVWKLRRRRTQAER